MIWDVNREAFSILGFGIYWYGILFALGFWCAYHLTLMSYRRILASRKGFYPHEINYKEFTLAWEELADVFDFSQLSPQEMKKVKTGEWNSALRAKIAILMSEMTIEEVNLDLDKIEQRLYNFVENKRRFLWRAGVEKCFPLVFKSLKLRAKQVIEKLTAYVVAGTIVGARLGHLLFYEDVGYYLTHPMMIFNTREGGLASHGAVIGIFLALLVFIRSYKKNGETIAWRAIVDMLVIPACVTGMFIRMGNFVNQEIIGLPTQMPWGIIFPHNFEGLSLVARHPAQLYEALAYLATAVVMWGYGRARFGKLRLGEMSGLFFILLFSARFIIEFFKASQLPGSFLETYLTIGQWLSLPLIAFGLVLTFVSYKSRRLWVDMEQVEVSI